MNIKDYSKYVIDNITRATCGNALNIANKFLNKEYVFKEFLINIIEYCEQLLLGNKLSKDKCYAVLYKTNEALKILKKPNYIGVYIFDDYLIDLWRILNED